MRNKHRMKMLLVLFQSIVFIGLIFQNKALASVPSWVTTPPKEKDAIIVVGVATATALEEARQAAILDAARQVGEYITTTFKVSGEKVRTEVEHRLIEEMKFSSEKMTLRGGLLKEWFFREVGGEYQSFVLVRYPRQEIEEIKSRQQANQAELATRARMDIQKGDMAWKRGNLLEAVNSFSQALQAGYGGTQPMLQSEARNRLNSLLQSLVMSIVFGDGQEIKLGARPQPLVVRVTSLTGGKEVPADGIPVRFIWGDSADKTASAITDVNGEVRINPDQPGFADSVGSHSVLAEIDNEAIFTRFLSPAGPNESGEITDFRPDIQGVTFTLKVIPVSLNTRVLILVEESNIGNVSPESIVMQSLSQSLQQAGFRVVAAHEIGRSNVERLQEAIRKKLLWPLRSEISSQVQLVITGTASTRRGSSNMGLAISSHADVFIKAVNIENGEVVAQKNLTSVAGFGETLELAGIRALEKAGTLATQAIVDQLILGEEVQGHESQ